MQSRQSKQNSEHLSTGMSHSDTPSSPDMTSMVPVFHAVVQRATYRQDALSPQDVLALQHSVGNQAVQRILANHISAHTVKRPVIRSQILQRRRAAAQDGDEYEPESGHPPHSQMTRAGSLSLQSAHRTPIVQRWYAGDEEKSPVKFLNHADPGTHRQSYPAQRRMVSKDKRALSQT